MNTDENADASALNHFSSPSALRQFALDTATQLRQAGLNEAADIMEAAANYAATTGSEWVGELGIAAKTILKRSVPPEALHRRVSRIAEAATSRHPYG